MKKVENVLVAYQMPFVSQSIEDGTEYPPYIVLKKGLGDYHIGQGRFYIPVITERAVEVWTHPSSAVFGIGNAGMTGLLERGAPVLEFYHMHLIYAHVQRLPAILCELYEEWSTDPFEDIDGPF